MNLNFSEFELHKFTKIKKQVVASTCLKGVKYDFSI